MLRATDALLAGAGPWPASLVSELEAELGGPNGVTELGVAVAMFHGLSKALIVLGLEPDDMATTVLPTPGSAPRPPA